jgi:hypothetical protein
MKTFIFIAFMFLLSVPIFAQQDTTIYKFPETEAAPKKEMGDFGVSLISALSEAYGEVKDIACMGKVHFIFLIEMDGSVSHLKCIDHCGNVLDDQLLKDCFKEKWIPATNKGKPVRSSFHIPINIDFY